MYAPTQAASSSSLYVLHQTGGSHALPQSSSRSALQAHGAVAAAVAVTSAAVAVAAAVRMERRSRDALRQVVR